MAVIQVIDTTPGSGDSGKVGGDKINANFAAVNAELATLATVAQLSASETASRNRANHTGTQAIATITGLQTALDSKEVAGAVANHEAAADPHPQYLTQARGDVRYVQPSALAAKADLVGGVIPTSQIPSIALVEFLGDVANQTAMLVLNAQPGDWCYRVDVGADFQCIASPPTLASSWRQIRAIPATYVTTVNSQTGTVVLGKADIGLGNVDNTSDIDKPLSTAVINAIANFETTSQLNARDANNRNRINHTGTQPIATIAGLQTELDKKRANPSHSSFEAVCCDFVEASAPFGGLSSTTTSGGSIVSVVSEFDHPGIIAIRDSATANAGVRLTSSSGGIVLRFGFETQWIVNFSNNASTVVGYLGFSNATSISEPTAGAYWRWVGNGSDIVCTPRVASPLSSGVSILLSASTWYRFRVSIEATPRFQVFSSSGNLISDQSFGFVTTQSVPYGIWCYESTTSPTSNLVLVDWYCVKLEGSLAR